MPSAVFTRLRLCCAVLPLVLLGVWARPAFATYRADFFDTSKRPTVTFDKKNLTWTLRNQGVERVIHFDAKTGGLQTLALRDLHTHHVLQPVPNSEGEISFAAPLLQTPVLLTGWKYKRSESGSAWMQAGFDDKSWENYVGLPPVHGGGLEDCYRLALPANRLKAGHAYALYLQELSDTEVYTDGILAYKRASEPARYNSPIQVDLPASCRVLAIKTRSDYLRPYLVEVGTSPPPLNLASGWQYMMYTVNAGEENSQTLAIRLSGVKQYEGFELDVSYQIQAGEEPTLAKWFSFVSHRKSRFLLEAVTYDRWQFPDADRPKRHLASASYQPYVPSILTNAASGDLLMTAQFARAASAPRSEDSKTLAPNTEMNVALTPEIPQATPHSLTAFWHGSASVGAFLHQLYIGQYIARGNPQAVPIAYSPELAYANDLDAATCEKIIPLAAGLGAQAFVLHDGWQSNITPDTGRYGDWRTDKQKFPKGLLPISTLVRENRLRFGLWIDAVRVNESSQAASAHPDWLYKSLASYSESVDDATANMCFTGAWARQFTQSIVSLCREQSVTYLQTRFAPPDDCMATLHEHPTGHSANATREFWKTFCDALYGANKTMTVVGYGSNSPLETQDTIEGYHWRLTRPDLTVTPDYLNHMAYWLREAGQWEHPLPTEDATDVDNDTDLFALPTFVRGGQALCHLPRKGEPTPEQSEYLWSSVAAFGCNFEIQGNMEQMTPDERKIGHKWIDWNLQNRDWLAFTQPLTLTPFDPSPDKAAGDRREGVSGVLHLRNALKGRYGYVCLWNLDATPGTVTPAFNPADYFVRMRAGDVKITNVGDGREVPFSVHSGTVSLGKITLPPYGWAIYEIGAK